MSRTTISHYIYARFKKTVVSSFSESINKHAVTCIYRNLGHMRILYDYVVFACADCYAIITFNSLDTSCNI